MAIWNFLALARVMGPLGFGFHNVDSVTRLLLGLLGKPSQRGGSSTRVVGFQPHINSDESRQAKVVFDGETRRMAAPSVALAQTPTTTYLDTISQEGRRKQRRLNIANTRR
ncbi:hypothetical protein V6N13_122364 [Hibiscus sabdariffa]